MALTEHAETAKEVAICTAQQSHIEHSKAKAQRLSLHLLDESQIQQECSRLDNIIASAEAKLLRAVREGDIRQARAEVLRASEAHARKAGYLASK